MRLTFKERRNVVHYKRAYTALRLSHAAMLRGEHQDYVAHYKLELIRSELGDALPAHVVAAIERAIDSAFGYPFEDTVDSVVNSRAVICGGE